jgi:hypothetical protein
LVAPSPKEIYVQISFDRYNLKKKKKKKVTFLTDICLETKYFTSLCRTSSAALGLNPGKNS